MENAEFMSRESRLQLLESSSSSSRAGSTHKTSSGISPVISSLMEQTHLPRRVPWVSTSEWTTVHSWFFPAADAAVGADEGGNADAPTAVELARATTAGADRLWENRARACDRVAAWRARGKVPLGVEATANFVLAQLHDRSGHRDELSLRQQYALCIIRFINGFCDIEQRGVVAKSLAAFAAQLAIPELLVDLRHEATHTGLPSIDTLRCAAPLALAWLKHHYWEQQVHSLDAVRSELREILLVFASSQLKEFQKMRKAKAEAGTGKQRHKPASKKARLAQEQAQQAASESTAVLRQLADSLAANTIRNTLIPELLHPSIVTAGKADRSTAELAPLERDAQQAIWTPILDTFCAAWPQFIPMFSASLLETLIRLEAEGEPLLFACSEALFCLCTSKYALDTTALVSLLSMLAQCPTRPSAEMLRALRRAAERARVPPPLIKRLTMLADLAQAMPSDADAEVSASPPSAALPNTLSKDSSADRALFAACQARAASAGSSARPAAAPDSGRRWQRSTDPRWLAVPLGALPTGLAPNLDLPSTPTPAHGGAFGDPESAVDLLRSVAAGALEARSEHPSEWMDESADSDAEVELLRGEGEGGDSDADSDADEQWPSPPHSRKRKHGTAVGFEMDLEEHEQGAGSRTASVRDVRSSPIQGILKMPRPSRDGQAGSLATSQAVLPSSAEVLLM